MQYPSDLQMFLERAKIIECIADPVLTAKAAHLLMRLLEEHADVELRRAQDTAIEDAFRRSVSQ